VVYMTTPAIPSCFVAFFSDPYSHFESFNFFILVIFWAMSSLLDCALGSNTPRLSDFLYSIMTGWSVFVRDSLPTAIT